MLSNEKEDQSKRSNPQIWGLLMLNVLMSNGVAQPNKLNLFSGSMTFDISLKWLSMYMYIYCFTLWDECEAPIHSFLRQNKAGVSPTS